MMLAASTVMPLSMPVTRRSVGKVQTIVVFTDLQDDFNKTAGPRREGRREDSQALARERLLSHLANDVIGDGVGVYVGEHTG